MYRRSLITVRIFANFLPPIVPKQIFILCIWQKNTQWPINDLWFILDLINRHLSNYYWKFHNYKRFGKKWMQSKHKSKALFKTAFNTFLNRSKQSLPTLKWYENFQLKQWLCHENISHFRHPKCKLWSQ